MSADTNASPTTYSSLPYLTPSFDYHNCTIARFYRVLQLFDVYFEYQSLPLSHNPVATALHTSRSSLRSYLICWLFTDYFCDNTVRFARSKLSWADIALCTCGTVAMFPSPSLNHSSFFYHDGLQLRSSLRYRNTQRFLMNSNTKKAQSLHLLAVKALRRRVYRPMTLESTTLDQQAYQAKSLSGHSSTRPSWTVCKCQSIISHTFSFVYIQSHRRRMSSLLPISMTSTHDSYFQSHRRRVRSYRRHMSATHSSITSSARCVT